MDEALQRLRNLRCLLESLAQARLASKALGIHSLACGISDTCALSISLALSDLTSLTLGAVCFELDALEAIERAGGHR